MGVQLVSLNEGPDIILDKPILLMGRHPECDIQIESRKVSRRHCCLALTNDQILVRDLDSTNGIRINGLRVNEGVLAPGDELTIGTHRYRLQWDPIPSRSKESQLSKVLVAAGENSAEANDPNSPIRVESRKPIPDYRDGSQLPLLNKKNFKEMHPELIIPESIDLLPPDSIHPI